jgi:Ca-activated chloride channel family protein
MSFAWPAFLWGLLLVPAAGVLYLLAQRRRKRHAVRFTNLELLGNLVAHTPGWRRHLPPMLVLIALSALLLGLARPQATVLVPREEANVVLLMDVSGSMEATDVSPNRLAAAQEAAGAFLDRLPDDLRVGLVTFSEREQVLALPTADHAAVRDALRALEAGGGTAMGDGLLRATEISQLGVGEGQGRGAGQAGGGGVRGGEGDGEGVPAAVVLLSDGSNTDGETEPEAAAERARALGVPVFTVALGTEEGTVEGPGGRAVPVPPDPETLRRIAEGTGGEFFASASEADLVRVYRDLGSSLGFVEEEREVTAAFAAAGAVLILAGGALSTLWFGRLP